MPETLPKPKSSRGEREGTCTCVCRTATLVDVGTSRMDQLDSPPTAISLGINK